CLRPEIYLEPLVDRDGLGQRHILVQAGEVPDLRIIAGNVADARVRRAGTLEREWSRAVRNEKVVHGRIEAPTPVRLPTIVRRHIWDSPPSEDGLGYAGSNADGRARLIDVDRAHAPVAKNGRRKPMVQPLFAFTKRQFVNQGEFEVVRDVELADGFLEAPVVLIGRR